MNRNSLFMATVLEKSIWEQNGENDPLASINEKTKRTGLVAVYCLAFLTINL